MKLYIIFFEDVDYEEDNAVLVSANNEKEAFNIAEIKESKDIFGSRYKDNIREIREIGIYNKDISEEIMSDNRGA